MMKLYDKVKLIRMPENLSEIIISKGKISIGDVGYVLDFYYKDDKMSAIEVEFISADGNVNWVATLPLSAVERIDN